MTIRFLVFCGFSLCFACADTESASRDVSDAMMLPIDAIASPDTAQDGISPTPLDASTPLIDSEVAEMDGGVVADAGPSESSRMFFAIGHTFSAEIGVRGRGVSIYSMASSGSLSGRRLRTEVSHPVTALDFVGDSSLLLVASEDGVLSTIDVTDPELGIRSQGQVSASGIVSVSSGRDHLTAVVNRDSSAEGGVYWVRSDLEQEAFLPIPLVYAASQCPTRDQWILVGGQTLFEPMMPNDIHLVELGAQGAVITAQADITDEIFDLRQVAVSDDCRFALFGNRSPFSDTFGRVFLVDLSGEQPELIDWVDTGEDVSEVMYLKSLDLFLLASFESETLAAYVVSGGQLQLQAKIERLGLLSGLVAVPMGAYVRLVVLSVHASSDSRIGVTDLTAPGQFGAFNWLPLGQGGENIPSMLSRSDWIILTDGE